ncbi:hypothetical protein ABZW30_39455 [Kitasatospora sp. NPDC004669]|uniref:hypothetical protein n=1 Tax=Kitasatospora sp. NPDC004669 TaxID=3154555 RepID=UPI0033A14707
MTYTPVHPTGERAAACSDAGLPVQQPRPDRHHRPHSLVAGTATAVSSRVAQRHRQHAPAAEQSAPPHPLVPRAGRLTSWTSSNASQPSRPRASTTSDDAVVGQDVHLPYAIQWWLFAALIPTGWIVLLRRDIRDDREKQAANEAAAAAGPTPDLGKASVPAADARTVVPHQ